MPEVYSPKTFLSKTFFQAAIQTTAFYSFWTNPMKLKPSDDNRWLPNTLPATPPCSRQAWRAPPWQNSS